MNTDYRKLCVELFGTDDIEQLKKIAGSIKNNRNAGRKRLFNKEEIENIEKMISEGNPISTVANKYNTSRQVINKYINIPPNPGYTMRITYMYSKFPCTIIDVDFLNEKIEIKNRTNDILHRAFGVIENPTWTDFQEFLKDRCFPKTRGNLKSILKDMKLDSYDTLQIVEKTKGKTADDNMWLKFKYYPQRNVLYESN